MVVHRAGDGHRVSDGFRLLVVPPQAATEMLLDHRVNTRRIGWREEERTFHFCVRREEEEANDTDTSSLNLLQLQDYTCIDPADRTW